MQPNKMTKTVPNNLPNDTIVSMALSLFMVVSITMVVYVSVFFTVSPQGTRLIVSSLADFLSGAIIPLPFLPNAIRQVVSLLPFASVQNVPFRIFGGDLTGQTIAMSMALQIFWLLLFVFAGRTMERYACKHIVIQGG